MACLDNGRLAHKTDDWVPGNNFAGSKRAVESIII